MQVSAIIVGHANRTSMCSNLFDICHCQLYLIFFHLIKNIYFVKQNLKESNLQTSGRKLVLPRC